MKRIGVGIIAGFILISVNAQTMRDVFITIPDAILLPLSAGDRMDLIDLYTESLEAVVQNEFGDKIVLNCLTEDYLSFQSGNATTELFLLTLVNESQIIGLIQTVCAQICDSRPEFYSLKWKKLNPDLFISPAEKSYFIADTADFPALDIALMEFHYDAEKQCLSQTYNTPAYLSSEDREIIARNTRQETKVYQWNGARFE
jgi:hypothetical protein